MSSGQRVNSLSDDPYAAEQASEIAAVFSENDGIIANNDQLISKLIYWITRCKAGPSVDNARTLGSPSPVWHYHCRIAAPRCLKVSTGMRKQVLSIANAQYNGVFMFSGTHRPAG